MNWASLSDFLAMGGYGLYVWGSFGMCAVVLIAECASLSLRRKALRELPFEDGDELNAKALHEA